MLRVIDFRNENLLTFTSKSCDMKYIQLSLLLFFCSGIQAQSWTKQYDYVDNCICGLSKVSKGNLYGYVDKEGKLVVPLIYDDAISFSEGFAAVHKNGKWGFIDSTGKVVAEPQYEEVSSFYEGMAAVRKQNKFGFIDVTMKVVIPFEFEIARRFSEGLAPVCNEKGLWGYIDKKGKLSLNYRYNFADLFANGKARVMKDGLFIVIDKEGKPAKPE